MGNNRKVIPLVLFLILTIMVIAIMGYMLYNMNINNENLEKQVEELANKENEEIVIEENSFELYQENYKKTYKQIITGKNTINTYIDDEFAMPGVQSIYIDQNNDAYLTFKENSDLYKKYGKEYKVESGVANIFLCPVGTGGYEEAIFLKLDGTASYVSGYKIEETSTVKCEKIEGVENAVNVITYVYQEFDEFGELGAAGPATVIIDINGNVIKEM